MKITESNTNYLERLADPLTKSLDYLTDREKRVFSATNKFFKGVLLTHFFDRYFTKDLCEETISSLRLAFVHKKIAHSLYAKQPISSKTLKDLSSEESLSIQEGKLFIWNNRKKTIEIRDLWSDACIGSIAYTDRIERFYLREKIFIFLPSTRTLVQNIPVWNIESKKQTCIFLEEGQYVQHAQITPNGKLLITSLSNHKIQIWDLASNTCIYTLPGSMNVNESKITSDGKILVLFSYDERENLCQIWNLESLTCISIALEHPSMQNTLTSDGKKLISRFPPSRNETAKVWDLKSGACIYTLTGKLICITPDAKHSISVIENAVEIRNIESGSLINILKKHAATIKAIKITPDGKNLFSILSDNTIEIWNIESGLCIHTLKGTKNKTNFIQISPDGKSFVLSLYHNFNLVFQIWDIESGVCTHSCIKAGKEQYDIAFSSDGKHLIERFFQGKPRIWNIYPLIEEMTSFPITSLLLDIVQYLEMIAHKKENINPEFILSAIPFTIDRIKTLPECIQKEIYAQAQNRIPDAQECPFEKFFSRINQLPEWIQDPFYEELIEAAKIF